MRWTKWLFCGFTLPLSVRVASHNLVPWTLNYTVCCNRYPRERRSRAQQIEGHREGGAGKHLPVKTPRDSAGLCALWTPSKRTQMAWFPQIYLPWNLFPVELSVLMFYNQDLGNAHLFTVGKIKYTPNTHPDLKERKLIPQMCLLSSLLRRWWSWAEEPSQRQMMCLCIQCMGATQHCSKW